jgi:hypothetical protein
MANGKNCKNFTWAHKERMWGINMTRYILEVLIDESENDDLSEKLSEITKIFQEQLLQIKGVYRSTPRIDLGYRLKIN